MNCDHQHCLSSTNSQQDIMDVLSLQTLASHWLSQSAKEGQTRYQSDKDCVVQVVWQDSWLSKKADEIQSFADRKDMKLFDALKTVLLWSSRAQQQPHSLLLSADGTSLLTDKEAILKRWAEHPDGVLNQSSSLVVEKLTVISCYVEKRCHSSRIQGCNNYLPIQTERESSSLWQSLGHLFIVDCWEDPCKSPTEWIEWIPWTVKASTRKPMWI